MPHLDIISNFTSNAIIYAGDSDNGYNIGKKSINL